MDIARNNNHRAEHIALDNWTESLDKENEMTKAIVTHESALAISNTVDRYNMMVEFVKTAMKKDKDYGVIPGSNKPTLLKPGAEKLTSLFGYVPRFVSRAVEIDFDKPLFFYQYECELYKDGQLIGTGLGSCNSMESKYRYRYVQTDKNPSKQESDALKAKGLGRWRKIDGAWVWHERVENDQIFDILNTIDKMAQKRALIAATLIACNASEFFTQDIEDMGIIIDAEYTPIIEPAPIPQTENVTAPDPEPIEPPASLMTLGMAISETSSTGEKYGDIPTDKLSHMANSLVKVLKNNSLTPEEREEKQRKLDACRVILAERAKQAA